MNDRPFEKLACKAQPLDMAPVNSKAGPLKTPAIIYKTPFDCWVPGIAKIFNNIPVRAGTLKQLINMGMPDGTTRSADKVRFKGTADVLIQLITIGITQPINKLPACMVQPLKQSTPVCMTQNLRMIPVKYVGGSPKQAMAGNRWEVMNVGDSKTPFNYIPIRHKVAMGCVSGMAATTIVHPLDVVKIRLQLFPKDRTSLQMLRRVLDCEGTRALYAGLTAALLRQATYTATRLAVYMSLLERYQNKHGKAPPLSTRLQIAVTAGLAGAFAGTPSEVALIRMTVEGRQRRSVCSPNCSLACKKVRTTGNAVTMLYRLACKEGVPVLWRGATPTLMRSLFVSTGIIVTHGEIHRHLRARNVQEGFPLHACTAVFSSFITAVISSPVDVVKTIYQMRTTEATLPEIFKNVLKKKGVTYFWKGFTPYYMRLTFHTMMTYFFMDNLTDVYLEAKRVLV